MKRVRAAHLWDTSTSTLKKACDYYTSVTGIPVPDDIPEPIVSQLEQAFAVSKSDDITLRMAIIRVVGGIEKPAKGSELDLIDRLSIIEGKFDDLVENVRISFIDMHDNFVEEVQNGSLAQKNIDAQSFDDTLNGISAQITKISERIDDISEEIETIRQVQQKKPKLLGWWPWA